MLEKYGINIIWKLYLCTFSELFQPSVVVYVLNVPQIARVKNNAFAHIAGRLSLYWSNQAPTPK